MLVLLLLLQLVSLFPQRSDAERATARAEAAAELANIDREERNRRMVAGAGLLVRGKMNTLEGLGGGLC